MILQKPYYLPTLLWLEIMCYKLNAQIAPVHWLIIIKVINAHTHNSYVQPTCKIKHKKKQNKLIKVMHCCTQLLHLWICCHGYDYLVLNSLISPASQIGYYPEQAALVQGRVAPSRFRAGHAEPGAARSGRRAASWWLRYPLSEE